ncbi:MAG: DNA-directed RNA polymerase II subunit [Claussenomyces sp. TS43310]|nr:MAG: DNA-directed RNA polymerase II subunit [Claussenomyces sp. TS43310]
MFFLYNLERQVTLHPSYFGRNMHELVTGKLLKDVEGTCTGRYYIITVMDTFDVSEGRILPGSGLAEFTVRYRAVVWRPFKGETVDAIVTAVNHEGFMALAGPLQLFVSRELISKDIKFDPNATPWQWTDNEDQVIEKGAQVRVKLLGIRSDVGAMYAIGSIKEDYLGQSADTSDRDKTQTATISSNQSNVRVGFIPDGSSDIPVISPGQWDDAHGRAL